MKKLPTPFTFDTEHPESMIDPYRYLGWLAFWRRLPFRVAAGRVLLQGFRVRGVSIEGLLVGHFATALGGHFALVDTVHRHATDIVNRVYSTGQTRRSSVTGYIRGRIAFFVVERLRGCLRDV